MSTTLMFTPNTIKRGREEPIRVGEYFLGFDYGVAQERYLMRIYRGKPIVLSRFPSAWTLEQCVREVRVCNDSALDTEEREARELAN